jgi:hypothetical protein
MAIDLSGITRTVTGGKRAAVETAAQPVADLNGWETERQALAGELAGIAELVSNPGDATVDTLERALGRREALKLRAGALDSKIATEQRRVAELEQAQREREAARLAAQAAATLVSAAAPILDARRIAGEAQRLANAAHAANPSAGPWGPDGGGAKLIDSLERVLCELDGQRFTQRRHSNGGVSFLDGGKEV